MCQLNWCLTTLDDEMWAMEEGVRIRQCMRANPDGLRCYLASCLWLPCSIGVGKLYWLRLVPEWVVYSLWSDTWSCGIGCPWVALNWIWTMLDNSIPWLINTGQCSVRRVLALVPHVVSTSLEMRLLRLLSLADVCNKCSLYDRVWSRLTLR